MVDNQIAIVGMAGRFPDATDVDRLWENLCRGKESITFFADDDLDPSVTTELKNDPRYVKARGVLDGADRFDAGFFGLSPREAQIMDPQQRLFLEVAWETLENAGYDPDRFEGAIGVFGGSGFNTYFANHIVPRPDLRESFGEHQTNLVNAPDYMTSRVSYKLNLRGPAVSLYTGCSTSLVAVCYACEGLLSFQCDLALAGGSFVRCPLNAGYLFREGEIFSPDGHCRPFDEKAQGTVFGDGVALVALRRLEDAVRDADHIYAVIRGTAVNNDGSDRVSFTAPSVKGQAEVIAMALVDADVSPDTITFVEAHGSGTQIGDPIELEALKQAFSAGTAKKGYCAIGSIKSNVGHLDAAAGVAGLIKAALALFHRKIPPSVNFDRPNAKIDFPNSPFFVNTKVVDWVSDGGPLRAGVSSFGVGGTNAHVVLEEAPSCESPGACEGWQLLVLSAKTPSALESVARKLEAYLKVHPHSNMADVAYTLQMGRKAFEHRQIVVCRRSEDAVAELESPSGKWTKSRCADSIAPPVSFLFTGQGAQHVNMGRGLYETQETFRAQVDRCAELLRSELSLDIREILYPAPDEIVDASARLSETSLTQPALFTIEYALARVWMSWGVIPQAMLGHSIGEYVAACLSGVWTLEDALKLVAHRGRLMMSAPKGDMLAVQISKDRLHAHLNGSLSLAAVNGPELCVVSGAKGDIADLETRLTGEGISATLLHTSHAFHSAMMDPVLKPFEEFASEVSFHPPKIPFLSNVSGTWIHPEEACSPSYWSRHIRETVRFSDCLTELFEASESVLLEVGPARTLSTLALQHPARHRGQAVVNSMRHPKEDDPDDARLLAALGQLWTSGVPVEWSRLHEGAKRHRLPLPTYAFERKRHWIEAAGIAPRDPTCEFSIVEPTEPVAVRGETNGEGRPEGPENVLADFYEDILGVDRIDRNDSFFELGGSSLMAVRLFDRIEKTFGMRLPLATLYDAPSVKQLGALLAQKEFQPSWSSIVEIQPGGAKTPVFFMHAEGGNVLEYYPLAKHLGAERPFYGLQALGLEGTEIVSTTIAEMAEHFIEEIKTVQPSGPYLLGGYCLGGLVAFEMAQQLQAAGETVAFLTLISTSTPDHLRSILPGITAPGRVYHRIKERVRLEGSNLHVLGFREKLLYVRERFYRLNLMVRVRVEDLLDPLMRRFGRTAWHSRAYVLQKSVDLSDASYMAYRPVPLDNKLLLFRVSERTAMLPRDPYLGWGGLARRGIEDIEVYGFHKNILKEPNVRALAETLRHYLDNPQTAKEMPAARVSAQDGHGR